MSENENGLLPVVIDDEVHVMCPVCGATHVASEFQDIEISWDDKANRYIVKLKIDMECTYDGFKQSMILTNIPVVIAEKTVCTCGSNMRLTDHSLNKKGKLLEFSGEYVCEKCDESRNTFFKKIGRGILAFWTKTKKIAIGPEGVTYEKEGSG